MVSTPQPMVSMIVSKAVNMCKQMKIRVLGVIENMSYIQCPNCNETIRLYETTDMELFLKENELTLYGELPMMKSIMNIHHDSEYDARTMMEIDALIHPAVEKLLNDLK